MNNKDLIKQYVDTGVKIPEYQMSKLPNSFLQTYLRKRLQAASNNMNIEKYEYNRMDDRQKSSLMPLIKKKMASLDRMEQWELDLLPDNAGYDYVMNRVSKNYMISQSVFEHLPDNIKRGYLDSVIKNSNRRIADYEWPYLTDEVKTRYVRTAANRALSNGRISQYERLDTHELPYLHGELADDYFEALSFWEDDELPYVSKNAMHDRIEKEITGEDPYISRKMFPYATDDQKYRYITGQQKRNEFIYSHEEKWLDDYIRNNS